MTNVFIFDVDGTLTPRHEPMDKEFHFWFRQWMDTHNVYIITGVPYSQIAQQLSEDILYAACAVYCNSGNSLWVDNREVRKKEDVFSPYVKQFLYEKLKLSSFPLRLGNHFEYRDGVISFTILGRPYTLGEKKLYQKWDAEHRDRLNIVQWFNNRFRGQYWAIPAGETSIDIFPVGEWQGKEQIVDFFNKEEKIIFFGDEIEQGNDASLAKALKELNSNNKCIQVNNWKETFSILQKSYG